MQLVAAPEVPRPPGAAGFLARNLADAERFIWQDIGNCNHPQLLRFCTCPDPLAAIAIYLVSVADEAEARGYAFNRMKITPGRVTDKIPVTRGQLEYEWAHLKAKLIRRDPLWLPYFFDLEIPRSILYLQLLQEAWKHGKIYNSWTVCFAWLS